MIHKDFPESFFESQISAFFVSVELIRYGQTADGTAFNFLEQVGAGLGK